ncbi:N-acetylglucosamine-6-phosphate deacetylase [Herbaspirillum seropedicae]|uniref:N-acetylglucosamine-6-phosphate deacetylase n=1 Tax=Herbaspirillum seropedicae TaxID=964 RepID=UPI003D9661DE
MNTPTELHGNVLTPQGWTHGSMVFDQRIRSIDGRPLRREPRLIDEGDYILPGFIDLHVHGGGGRDVMEGGDAVQVLARLHARHGTTSLLATTMTAPLAELEVALKAIRTSTDTRPPGHARVLGVHLEGPYINPGKLGAQPAFAIEASLDQVDHLNSLAPIRLITIAPEVDGHLKLVCKLAHRGMKVQIGHTDGSYDDGVAALAHGASGFTHLFNAMSGFHHRAPGMVGAALAHAQYAELIPDLLHVHPGAIRAALRSIPRLFCVTDSTAAAGMPDGDYALGRQVVHKCAGGVRLDDGTLAGSILTMDQALRNLISLGMDVAEASLRTSTYAADYLGLADRGRLATGCHADVVVLDRQFALKAVYVEGEEIDLADA